MLLHPECQRRAQQEIDAVVGHSRLPDFSDRDTLPYLECILHETHRSVLYVFRSKSKPTSQNNSDGIPPSPSVCLPRC